MGIFLYQFFVIKNRNCVVDALLYKLDVCVKLIAIEFCYFEKVLHYPLMILEIKSTNKVKYRRYHIVVSASIEKGKNSG